MRLHVTRFSGERVSREYGDSRVPSMARRYERLLNRCGDRRVVGYRVVGNVVESRFLGTPLYRFLPNWAPDIEGSLLLWWEAVKTVSAAHAIGVYHGHISPANVFVGEDEVLIKDWGLAAFESTITGRRVDEWMAPETPLTGPTPGGDVFSLTKMLHYILYYDTPPDNPGVRFFLEWGYPRGAAELMSMGLSRERRPSTLEEYAARLLSHMESPEGF